jgi:hypothetical protein
MNLIELIVKDEATKLAELDTTLADRRKRRNRRKSAGREIWSRPKTSWVT